MDETKAFKITCCECGKETTINYTNNKHIKDNENISIELEDYGNFWSVKCICGNTVIS